MGVRGKRALFFAVIRVVASAILATLVMDKLWREWAVFAGLLIAAYLVTALIVFRPRRWSFREDLVAGCFLGIALGTASWLYSFS